MGGKGGSAGSKGPARGKLCWFLCKAQNGFNPHLDLVVSREPVLQLPFGTKTKKNQ